MSQTQNFISLSQLQARVKKSLQSEFSGYFWVVAEVSEVSVNAYSGHCYLTLVEKNEDTQLAKARVSANIWAKTYALLEPYFRTETGRGIEIGMKLLLKVTLNFHDIYGISLNVTDIDPAYTLGDIERQRKMIIEALRVDGLLDLNKQIQLPTVLHRLAVVSSVTAAGFRDFEQELRSNERGFKYDITLFSTIMQGDNAQFSIIDSLRKISENAADFDAVIVIRGGGAQSDLACFDQYELCCEIATMPLAVITGIGHDKDVSIADMTAHTSLKTPTAVARFIVDYTEQIDDDLNEKVSFLLAYVSDYFAENKQRIERSAQFLKEQTVERMHKEEKTNEILLLNLKHQSLRLLEQHERINKDKMSGLHSVVIREIGEKRGEIDAKNTELQRKSLALVNNQCQENEKKALIVEGYNPMRILKNGYAIAQLNNKIISSGKDVTLGDTINIRLSDVELSGKVTEIKNI